MYSNNIIDKLLAWVGKDIRYRVVDIKINHTGVDVWVYDHKRQTGYMVKEDTNIDELDKLIEDKSEEKLKRQYEELRNRFDINKEGI